MAFYYTHLLRTRKILATVGVTVGDTKVNKTVLLCRNSQLVEVGQVIRNNSTVSYDFILKASTMKVSLV